MFDKCVLGRPEERDSNTDDSTCTGKTSVKDNLAVSIKIINAHLSTLISTARNLSYRITITLMK